VPATDDHWDVVVVGLRDPSHANTVMVIAELAHYASIPPHEVERMLDEGEVSVVSNLDRAEAERAAYELSELGAVVDLRLTDATSGVFPVLKPDADRQVGVAVGGLIDDSATPPTVGESRGGLPEVEPDPEVPSAPRSRSPTPSSSGLSVTLGSGVHRMPTGQHRPAITRGQGPEPIEASPYAEPVPRSELLTDRGPPGLGEEPIPAPRPGERRPGEYGLHRGDARPTRPRTQTPRPRTQTPRPQAGPAKPKPKKKKKKNRSDIEGLLGDIGPAAPAETPKLPKRLEQATAVAKQSSGPLELDFEAAGIQRPPPRFTPSAPVSAPMHQAEVSASAMPRRSRAPMGGTGASAAGHGTGQGGGVVDVLRNDGVAGLILGLGVGLILSMVLALQLQRGDVRDRLPGLEDELAASINDPAGVEAGDRRAPASIEGEINQTLDEIERKFLLWWLGVGLPVGLLLSRLRSL
jgi:hypothetical protein